MLKSAGHVVILSKTYFNSAFETPVPFKWAGGYLIVLNLWIAY
jgi:hypothetical protein